MPAGQQLEQDDADRVEVGARVGATRARVAISGASAAMRAGVDLRAEVVERLERARQTEVGHLDAPGRVDHAPSRA